MHDRNVDEHDDHEAEGVGEQGHDPGDGELAECTFSGFHRGLAGQHVLLPGVGHLYGVGDPDRKDQEGHQHRHRVDAIADQRQQAEQPDHRQQGYRNRQHGELERARIHPQQQRGDDEGDGEEHHHRKQPVHHVAHDLGEADDLDVDLVAGELCANRLEFAGDTGVIEMLTGFWIDLEQVGLDQRGLQVVRNQAAHHAGLGDVAADLVEAGFVGFETGRNDDVAVEAFFGHLDVAHVRGEDRAHASAVDARGEEDLIIHLAQDGQEFGVVDVAFAFPLHADEDSVGAGEGPRVLQEGGHVLVLERDELVEARVEAGVQCRIAKAERQQKEEQAKWLAPLDQHAGKDGDDGVAAGDRVRGVHQAAPSFLNCAAAGARLAAGV